MYVPASPTSNWISLLTHGSHSRPFLPADTTTTELDMLFAMPADRVCISRRYGIPRFVAGRNAKKIGFESRTEIANWVNVVALVASIFLLASFAILDVKWTHRHYLSVCLTISVVAIEVFGRASTKEAVLTASDCLSPATSWQSRSMLQRNHPK